MQAVLKCLLALALGIGFLVLGAHAQPAAAAGSPAPVPVKARVAFLGMAGATDPQIAESLSRRIREILEADTGIESVSGEAVERLYAQGVLRGPDQPPADSAALRRGVGNAYLAFGRLERISVASRRIWWKPWSLNTTWTQPLRLRIAGAIRPGAVFDSLLTVEVREKDFLKGPEKEWGRMPPLERDRRQRTMVEAVATEAAKLVSRAVRERAGATAAQGAAG